MQRLKTRPQFQVVLAGAVVAKTFHFALHRHVFEHELNMAGCPALFASDKIWLGAMVPKRWAKRAVTRNTIKRQIYTVSAEFQHQFFEAAWLVRLRREFARKEFVSATSGLLKEAVRAEVIALLEAGTRTA